jgi:prepilin-type N-terminal cleavage/methylation domain-containing protein
VRNHRAFTLVELLVAGAILGILLTVLANLFVSSNRASQRVDQLSDQQQQAQATRQVLQYELGLAGYKGTDNGFASRTFTGSTLTVTTGANSTQPDSIQVQYFEDRNYASTNTTVARTVTFSIGDDNGTSSLFRRQDTGSAVAIIPGVSNLKVASYIRHDDSKAVTEPNNLSALELNVTYTSGNQDTILVVFQNAQTITITP